LKILEQRDVGTCKKTVKIEIPPDEVGTELDELYKEFIENAIVPGFRKGKAPRRIVKMKYGKHLDSEAVEKAVETAFKKAMEELDLTPVDSPQFSEIDKEKTEEPVVFEATFEYAPRLESVNYRDIRPEVPPMEVTEKDVVDTLNHLRETNATYRTIDDRPAAEGDHVTIACNATIEGQPFPEATHYGIVVEVGSKRYIPGLEDALIGMKPGEKKTITLTLPEDYPEEEKRGKEAVFELEVQHIRQKLLPELDDEFAKDMGNFQTLHDLKERIRENLRQTLAQRRRDQLRQAIRQELIRRNPFDVPPSMIRARYNFINAVHDLELQRIGTSLEQEAKRDEGLLARHEKTAEEEVRISLLVEKIAAEESIELTDQDYYLYMHRTAPEGKHDVDWYVRRIESMGMESFYRRMALEEKVLDILQARVESASGEAPDLPAEPAPAVPGEEPEESANPTEEN